MLKREYVLLQSGKNRVTFRKMLYLMSPNIFGLEFSAYINFNLSFIRGCLQLPMVLLYSNLDLYIHLLLLF